VRALLDQGADIVSFSGDKMLGGPQAGIALGRRDLIDAMRKNPLYRVLRLDKMTIAALEATLDAYVRGSELAEIPVLRMIFAARDEIAARAARLSETLRTRLGAGCDVATQEGVSRVGGGSAPTEDLPTMLLVLRPTAAGRRSVDDWEQRLRTPASSHLSPVVARIHDDALVLDLRTVEPSEEADLVEALAASQT
jgi:L-seryl-tRNA(Ser) seleniumtransferase